MHRTLVFLVALALFVPVGCGDDGGASTDTNQMSDIMADVTSDADMAALDGEVTHATDGSLPDASDELCDPVDQLGCLEGEKCQIDRQGQPECLLAPAPGDAGAVGEACGGDTGVGCGVGLQCVVMDGVAACHTICRSDGTGCDSGEVCNINPATASRYMYCSTAVRCDVLTQEGCDTDQACIGGNDPMIGFITLCQGAGVAAQGEACDQSVSCVAGATCLRFVNMGLESYACVTYCDEADGTCPAGNTCNDGAVIGFEGNWAHVGICY